MLSVTGAERYGYIEIVVQRSEDFGIKRNVMANGRSTIWVVCVNDKAVR